MGVSEVAAIWRGRCSGRRTLELMGGRASSFNLHDRVSQERALVNLEPPMCWIDVHCSYGLDENREISGSYGIEAGVIYSHPLSTYSENWHIGLAIRPVVPWRFPHALPKSIEANDSGSSVRPLYPPLLPASRKAALARHNRRPTPLLL